MGCVCYSILGGDVVAIIVEAIYEHGMFRPRGPVPLSEGQIVEVLIPEPGFVPADETFRDLLALAGLVNGGDPEAATEVNVAGALASEYAGSHDGP